MFRVRFAPILAVPPLLYGLVLAVAYLCICWKHLVARLLVDDLIGQSGSARKH